MLRYAPILPVSPPPVTPSSGSSGSSPGKSPQGLFVKEIRPAWQAKRGSAQSSQGSHHTSHPLTSHLKTPGRCMGRSGGHCLSHKLQSATPFGGLWGHALSLVVSADLPAVTRLSENDRFSTLRKKFAEVYDLGHSLRAALFSLGRPRRIRRRCSSTRP